MPYIFGDEFYDLVLSRDRTRSVPDRENAVANKRTRYDVVLDRLETIMEGRRTVCRADIRLVEKKGRRREQHVRLESTPNQTARWSVRTDSPWSVGHGDIYIEVAKRALPPLIAQRVAEVVAACDE